MKIWKISEWKIDTPFALFELKNKKIKLNAMKIWKISKWKIDTPFALFELLSVDEKKLSTLIHYTFT